MLERSSSGVQPRFACPAVGQTRRCEVISAWRFVAPWHKTAKNSTDPALPRNSIPAVLSCCDVWFRGCAAHNAGLCKLWSTNLTDRKKWRALTSVVSAGALIGLAGCGGGGAGSSSGEVAGSAAVALPL